MRALLLCLAFGLAACDSAGPAPVTPITPGTPPTGPARSFRFASVPASITVDVPDTRALAFSDLLGRPLPVGFRAAPTLTGGAAAFDLVDDHTLRAVIEGAATLRVAVSAPGYRDTTLTVPLVSRVLCPPARPAGTQDVFPALNSAQFRSTWLSRSSRENALSTGEGVLTLESGDAASCYKGTRSTPVSYRYAGTTTFNSGAPQPVSQQATGIAVEDSTNTVTLPVLSPIDGFQYPVVFARYGTEPERVVREPFYRTCTRQIRLAADTGLVEDGVPNCYLGFGLYKGWSLTRISGRHAGGA